MLNKYVKKCSVSFVVREIQTKTIIRYHFTFPKMTNKPENTKYRGACEPENSSNCR